MKKTAIHWFRRDLRLADNPALASAARSEEVIPVFILDPKDDAGAASRWWLDRSLRELERAIAARGGRLILRRGDPLQVLQALMKETGAGRLTWNRLYEPRLIERDRKIKEILGGESFNGSLLYEPTSVEKATGGSFRVFTPFWRRARETEPERPVGTASRLKFSAARIKSESIDALKLLPEIRWDKGLEADWAPGEKGARDAVREFLRNAADGYKTTRDIPGVPGTSRLSAYLHFGEISPHRLWWDHIEKGPSPERQDSYLGELGWREFAHHILFHYPRTVSDPMNARFENFPWRRSASDLRAWQKGETGFPIVDAGMRQLWRTGWMHNRVRMIAASFLVKQLGVDWREGMRWFWDTLVDADLAANTMGWQWSAGCGADAAPYFRVFSPILQGERFDPKGAYVRRWIPELAEVPDRYLHKPWEAPHPPNGYPAPIVDYREARARALALYERWKRGS